MALISEAPLISTIVMGLSAAFIGGVAASKLRLSPIVGYLLAGIVIGPFTPGIVANASIAQELSEIGIVLLMFGVGLHFSMKDLLEVRNIALPGALAQIGAATLLGLGVSQLWGWSIASGLLLGLALSVASTVVLIRALEERSALESINGRIAIGWLIVEDLVMVLALVLIPALAGTAVNGEFQVESASEWLVPLGIAIGKLTLFVVFMLVVGKRILPWMLEIVAATRSRELFTLAVFVVAVGVAFGVAALFDVSFALGAFFAGMMIKESDLCGEVAEKALPFQDAFAVLFFVSVGMLFNPAIILDEPIRVLMVVLIILVGKSLAAFAIVLLFRYPLNTALIVSASLAQIGEFSFILAALGMRYQLLPEEANSLILAGALISISLNPLVFHGADVMHRFVARYPRLAALFKMTGDDLDHLSAEEQSVLKDRVILIGHGRVGRHIQKNISSAKMDLVVIDMNRGRVGALRDEGFHAISGDAAHEEVLREAGIEQAVAIIIAVPNPFEARRIVDSARGVNPKVQVLVRAHNEEELEYFAEQNVHLAVMGPQEVGRRMVEYLHERMGKKTAKGKH